MGRSFIFYGAGSYGRGAVDRHIAMDVEPACFADRDEKKHYRTIKAKNGKEYEILPLREAVARYPDFVLIVTVEPSLFAGVCHDLIERAGIPSERIGPPLFYNQPGFRDSPCSVSPLQEKLVDSAVKKLEIFHDRTNLTVDVLGDGRSFKMCMEDTGANVANALFKGKRYEVSETRMQHRLLSMLPGDSTVFDVGANVGFYSLCYKTWFPGMTVHAFEPVPFNYDIMMENLALSQIGDVIANRFGFFDEEKKVEFHYYRHACGGSSVKNILGLGEAAFTRVECSVTTLDSYVGRANARVGFMKCDVEGSELYVYKGGMETLKRDKPVVFSEIVHSAAFGYRHNDIVSLFADLGYACHVIEDDRLRAIETITEDVKATNFIFIHSAKLEQFQKLIRG